MRIKILSKQVVNMLLGALLGAVVFTVNATPNSVMQVYISPEEYTNPIHLQFPWGDQEWVSQGQIVEPIAAKSLQEAFGAVQICQGTQTSSSLMWLRPSLFFNPQVGVYYGTMTAYIYDGNGKPINKYVGESNVQGSFYFKRQENIHQSYRLAMQNLVAKLKADNAVTDVIASDLAAGETYASCSQVPNLPNNLPAYTPYKDRFLKPVNP